MQVFDQLFQSTPVIADGRTITSRASPTCPLGFNPRPSSLTGEPDTVAFSMNDPKFQSTPVIADGRTASCHVSPAALCEFQSTPVIADGRTRRVSSDTRRSMLFQSTPVIADGRTASSKAGSGPAPFQSTPVIADGRTVEADEEKGLGVQFQSTPVIADGRTHCPPFFTRVCACFNPRPSSLTGERADHGGLPQERGVSIHARHR